MKFVFTFLTMASFLVPVAAFAQMGSAIGILNMSEPGTGSSPATLSDEIIPFFDDIEGQWSAPSERAQSYVTDSTTKQMVSQSTASLTNLKVVKVDINKWRFTFSLCEGPSCVEVSSVFKSEGDKFFICSVEDCLANAALTVREATDSTLKWSQAYDFPLDPANPDSIMKVVTFTDLRLYDDGKMMELSTAVYADKKIESTTTIQFARNLK